MDSMRALAVTQAPPQPPPQDHDDPVSLLVSHAKSGIADDDEMRALRAAASYNDEAAGFLVSLEQNSLASDEDHCALLKAAAAATWLQAS